MRLDPPLGVDSGAEVTIASMPVELGYRISEITTSITVVCFRIAAEPDDSPCPVSSGCLVVPVLSVDGDDDETEVGPDAPVLASPVEIELRALAESVLAEDWLASDALTVLDSLGLSATACTKRFTATAPRI